MSSGGSTAADRASGGGVGWLRAAISGGRQQQQQPVVADLELPVRTDSGGQPSQPRAVGVSAPRPPRHLDVGAGSSGAGLPSALATPSRGHCSSYQDDPADGVQDAAADAGISSDSDDGAAGSGGSGDPPSAAARAEPPGGRQQQQLPSSGSSQLDDYLNYLLRGAHSHKSLWFCDWGCSEDACAALGEFFRRDRRIRVAALSGNSISDEGAELLAEGLCCNSTLASLDLSQNDIGDDGALALAEALTSTSTLADLNLSGNRRISDEGAEALAAAAASSSTLKKVGLAGTLVSPAQLQVVAHVLKTRQYALPSEPRAVPAATAAATAAGASGSSRRWPHIRKPSSQLFDIELTEGELPRSISSSHTPASRQRHTGDLLHLPPAIAVQALTAHTDPLEASIATQVEQAVLELGGQQQQQQQDQDLLLQLALRLAARGYHVVLRTCFPALDGATAAKSPDQHQHLTQQHQHQHQHQHQQPQRSSRGSFGGEGLRHTTLRVSQPAAAQTPATLLTCVVDPAFTQQWLMPQPSARYLSVLASLPPVLCLAEPRLYHLLQRLSGELAMAFQATRLSLPPWRAAGVMRDKWLGLTHFDVPVVAADDAGSVDALATQLAASLAVHHHDRMHQQQQQQHHHL